MKKVLDLFCIECNKKLVGKQQKYCGELCAHRHHYPVKFKMEEVRICVECGEEYYVENNQCRNQKYCSDECRRKVQYKRQKEFRKNNPQNVKEYERKRTLKNGSNNFTNRFFRRHPEVERKCIGCGENRVIDLHHIIPRRGVPRRAGNTTPDTVYVLCPTCHALIERLGYTLEELRNGKR